MEQATPRRSAACRAPPWALRRRRHSRRSDRSERPGRTRKGVPRRRRARRTALDIAYRRARLCPLRASAGTAAQPAVEARPAGLPQIPRCLSSRCPRCGDTASARRAGRNRARTFRPRGREPFARPRAGPAAFALPSVRPIRPLARKNIRRPQRRRAVGEVLRIAAAVHRGQGREDLLLPRLFAGVREASARSLGLRQFEVQVMGAHVMWRGGLAEMATGETSVRQPSRRIAEA